MSNEELNAIQTDRSIGDISQSIDKCGHNTSTMLSVKNWNILRVMPQIKEEIEESVLIAFDTELSGIGGGRLNASFDSLEERYNNVKQIVHKYSVVQLGITFFRHDKKNLNKYIGSTYSFHLFDNLNKSIDETNCNISFNYKSFQFLIANMFDMQEWAKDGLYFLRESNREHFKENFDLYVEETCTDLNREITNDIFYIVSWLRQYKFENSLYSQADDTNSGHEYECRSRLKLKFKPTSNDLFNYYFVMKIRKFLLERNSINAFLESDEYLWCENHHNECFFISVVKLVDSDDPQDLSKNVVPRQYSKYINDIKILQEMMKSDKESLIERIFSISTIFGWISQSKALIVGHNFFMDLLFIYHNFFDKLPETFSEFKEKIHALFPKIYDTKLIAQQERILKLRYTSLLDCFVHLCLKREAYRNCVPDIFIRKFNDILHPNKDDYMNALDIKRFQKIEAHNAGFDSFITGFVFLYFGFVLMRQAKPISQRKSDRQMLCDYRIFLENSFKPHCNKLHLARNCNLPLSLVGTIPPRPRFYSKVALKFNNKTSLDVFQKFLNDNLNIDWRQKSQLEYIVGATHPDKMELFLYGLVHQLEQAKQTLSIKKHEDDPKLMTFRKIFWFTFLSSTTCFTLLFTRFLLNRG